MKQSKIHIDSIGTIVLAPRKGASRMTMRINSDQSVRVGYPPFISKKEILDFIHSNYQWIKKHQEKVQNAQPTFEIGSTLKTFQHTIYFKETSKRESYATPSKTEVTIFISKCHSITSTEVSEFVVRVLEKVYRSEAKSYLPDRVMELASMHGFQPKKIFIKKLKSKWGSCSSLGNINLNLFLMKMPVELIDYIILHELTHLEHPNHGPGFWKKLNELTHGNAKKLDNQIKKYRPSV